MPRLALPRMLIYPLAGHVTIARRKAAKNRGITGFHNPGLIEIMTAAGHKDNQYYVLHWTR